MCVHSMVLSMMRVTMLAMKYPSGSHPVLVEVDPAVADRNTTNSKHFGGDQASSY